jgi:hypothetical protein
MHENAGGEGFGGQLTRFPELYKGCQDSSENASSSICLGGCGASCKATKGSEIEWQDFVRI